MLSFTSSSLASVSHGEDLFPSFLLVLGATMLLATLGESIARGRGLPGVLSHLVLGLIFAILSYCGMGWFFFMTNAPPGGMVDMAGQLGLLFLVFGVGLHNNIDEFRSLGAPALIVALTGVAAPFALGWLAAVTLLPGEATISHVFIGACLTATSIAVASSVLRDAGVISTRTAQITIAAAVLDDVLVLFGLSLAQSVVQAENGTANFEVMSILWPLAKALIFGGLVFTAGEKLSHLLFRLFHLVDRNMGNDRTKLFYLEGALVLCPLFSVVAWLFGLAPIIGAFAAGLVLNPKHFKRRAYREEDMERFTKVLEGTLSPLIMFFAPVFFVLVGARVDVSVFSDKTTILLGLCLTVAAIIGKAVSGVFIRDPKVDRLSVGFGMACRGEVAVIFVGVGAQLSVNGVPIIGKQAYGALIFTVICTALLSPFLLNQRLRRRVGTAKPEPG